MNKLEKTIFSIGIFFFGIKSALAVPPPDFIFNVGAQVAQFFSIAVIFLGAILVTVRQAAKVYFIQMKNKKIIWIGLVIGVIGIASVGAYYYDQYQQTIAYQKWLEESKIQNTNVAVSDTSLDQLKINEIPSTEEQKQEKIPRPKETPDVQFIRTYYANLASGRIEAAYEVSKKSVSLETYKSWYKNVTSLNIDDLQKIDTNKYSLRLTLKESEKVTSYAVLMTITADSQGNFKIQSSDVRTLTAEESPLQAGNTSKPLPEDSIKTEGSFYEKNKDLPLAISNNNFQPVSSGNIFVLDAREDEEYDIGKFPNSTHIRFADLISGEWIHVPTDQVVYVFCWSGIRGKEVADFLRSKEIVAQYIQNGADGWVSYGGQWTGGIKFSSQYPQERYAHLVTLDELKEKSAQGAVIVDSRIKDKYNTWHIPDSINIPIIYTPSSKIDDLLNEVPSGKPVITICDDFVSCFDAKITGLKLERKSHEFLGRYNKPWEYRSSQ